MWRFWWTHARIFTWYVNWYQRNGVFQTSRLSFGGHDHYSLNLLPVQKLMFRSWTCTSSPLCFRWCSREHKLKTRTYNGLRINYSEKYLPDVFTRTISVLWNGFDSFIRQVDYSLYKLCVLDCFELPLLNIKLTYGCSLWWSLKADENTCHCKNELCSWR